MPEIGFGVDWTTVLLQALNFLILLLVLQRFLYRPLRAKMQEREAEIESEISAAEERARAAERERAELEARLDAATAEAEKIRRDAREEAAERREEILEGAREEAAEVRREASERIRREEQAARERIQTRARRTAVELAEELLRETGGRAVHDRIVDRFRRGEDDLGDADLERLADGIREAEGAVRVRSAYPLEADAVEGLREALQVRLPRDAGASPSAVDLTVEEAPELVAGITLLVGDVALDLNVRHALEELIEDPTGTDEPRADSAATPTDGGDGEPRRDAAVDEPEDDRDGRASPRENGGGTD